jgi:hypothetical protein
MLYPLVDRMTGRRSCEASDGVRASSPSGDPLVCDRAAVGGDFMEMPHFLERQVFVVTRARKFTTKDTKSTKKKSIIYA